MFELTDFGKVSGQRPEALRESSCPAPDQVSARLSGGGSITIDKKEKYSHGLRWKLGINTNPCVQLRKGARCLFCGFLNYHDPIPPDRVGDAFRRALVTTRLTNVHRLELYVSGSFFDDEEVSFDSRLQIARLIAVTGIREVVLETRPEFVTGENLRSLSRVIDAGRVTIAIGVETMNDVTRGRLLKCFSTSQLVESISTIARCGMNFQAYLLLNPPAINDDERAIADVMDSSTRLMSLAAEMRLPLVLAVQPFFVARNSLAAERVDGRPPIRPPWLYTIALTLRLLQALRKQNAERMPHIILGNEVDNVDTISVPSNYTREGDICACSDRTRTLLHDTNTSQARLEENIRRILESTCECREVWEQQIGRSVIQAAP